MSSRDVSLCAQSSEGGEPSKSSNGGEPSKSSDSSVSKDEAALKARDEQIKELKVCISRLLEYLIE